MKTIDSIKLLYKRIQNDLFYMIPEKWDKVYLYCAIVEKLNKLEIGEMYFYYYPKGVLKKNPINVYEIASKFNLDETEYQKVIERLYLTLKQLRNEFKKNNITPWSNITIKIENHKFQVEYYYDDLVNSRFDSSMRLIVWKYKNLEYPLEKFTRKERKIIKDYLSQEKLDRIEPQIYKEQFSTNKRTNIIDYNKQDEIGNNFNIEHDENTSKPKKTKQIKSVKQVANNSNKNEIVNDKKTVNQLLKF